MVHNLWKNLLVLMKFMLIILYKLLLICLSKWSWYEVVHNLFGLCSLLLFIPDYKTWSFALWSLIDGRHWNEFSVNDIWYLISSWTSVIQILLMNWRKMQLRKMIGLFCWNQGLHDQHQQNSMHRLSKWIWLGHFLSYTTPCILWRFILLFLGLTFLYDLSRFLTMDDSFLLENRMVLRAM